MRTFFIGFLILLNTTIKAQDWFAEIMLGAASYNGDLTQREISFLRWKPAVGVNIKYNTGDFINLRLGLTYATLGADDKDNPDAGLRSRNLNFKTRILELNLCAELNILDPETYFAYPYIFGGIGGYHFNPYTYDDKNQKTFLQPLGTEGEGLPDYPGRKKYPLYQACFPLGGGFKLNLQDKYEVCWEFGYRILLTDYIDDVSRTYVNLKTLEEGSGAKAVELSYRKKMPFMEEGEKRGNSGVRDSYFFTGFKIGVRIGTSRKYYD